MRKFLIVAGALTALALIGSGAGSLAINGRSLDIESKAYVDEALPAIATTWSGDQLLRRASDQLRQNTPPDRLNVDFDALSVLGSLKRYDGATGEVTTVFVLGAGKAVTATYTAKGEFQNGSATFRILLLKQNGRRSIQDFHVDPVFAERRREPV